MGPIADEHGLEQGGCNSSDNYKVYNNELLDTVQSSCQGVNLRNNQIISGVGQADDAALSANNIFNLFNILHLALNYCRNYHVELAPEKSKLLLLTSNPDQKFVPYNPLKIKDQPIDFSNQAEHVGVLRSTEGNLPHILGRIVAHKKALGSVLFCGAARNHRGNLAAAIKIEKLHAMPVLFSGVASLVLSNSEVNLLDQHYTCTLRNLLKANVSTPRSFVFFMFGSLPAKALLHLRLLSLFSMITRLPDDPLNTRARYVLTAHQHSSKSWFKKLRETSLLYGLPHPLSLLENPPLKGFLQKTLQECGN